MMTPAELKVAIVRAWPREVFDKYEFGEADSNSLDTCCGMGDVYAGYNEQVDMAGVFAALAERGRVLCTSTQKQPLYAKALKAFGFRKCGPRSKNRWHGDNYVQLWDLTYDEFRKKWKLPPIRKVKEEEERW